MDRRVIILTLTSYTLATRTPPFHDRDELLVDSSPMTALLLLLQGGKKVAIKKSRPIRSGFLLIPSAPLNRQVEMEILEN